MALVHRDKPGMNEVQYQMRNWYHFPWLCGDNIGEQHVHNLDVMNWGIGAPPISAVGMGGRQTPITGPDDGVKFDHFAVDFEYPNGVHVLSMCRQINGCQEDVSKAFVGTKGMWDSHSYKLNGKGVITREQDKAAQDPYVQEHTDLIESIRSGKPLNELKQVAESTMTCILGRMTTYTGEADVGPGAGLQGAAYAGEADLGHHAAPVGAGRPWHDEVRVMQKRRGEDGASPRLLILVRPAPHLPFTDLFHAGNEYGGR